MRNLLHTIALALLLPAAALAQPINQLPVVAPLTTDTIPFSSGYSGLGTGVTRQMTVQSLLNLPGSTQYLPFSGGTLTGPLNLPYGGTLTSPTIAGAALSGTLTGSPTFSGTPVFSGTPTLNGTLGGTGSINIGGSVAAASATLSGAGTNGAQILFFAPSASGSYVAPTPNPYNCDGTPGVMLLCNGGDSVAYGYASGPAGMDQLRILHQFGGTGTTGGREVADFILDLTAATSDTQGAFYQALRTETDANATAGGTSSKFAGDFFSGNSYTYLNGNYYVHSIDSWEFDLAAATGSTVHEVNGISVILLGGHAVAGDFENFAYTIGAQGSTPTFTCGYCDGTYDGTNALASNAALVGFIEAANSGVGPIIGYAVDGRLATFNGAAIGENGGDIFGNGSVRIGRSYLTDSSAGLTITGTGSIGTTAMVAAGGSGYTPTNLNATDAYGGIWELTINGSGVVTAVTMLRAPAISGAPPANPLALTSLPAQPGTGATINVTWATGTGTAFAGTITSTGNGEFASAGGSPITLSSGMLTTANSNFTLQLGGGFSFVGADGGHGDFFSFAGPAGTIGSYPVFIAGGTGVAFELTASGSDTNRGISIVPGGTGMLTLGNGTGDLLLGNGSALATAATTGFLHLPFTTAAPTGTPATIDGNACEFNTATETLNCYVGTGWYHVALIAGAG